MIENLREKNDNISNNNNCNDIDSLLDNIDNDESFGRRTITVGKSKECAGAEYVIKSQSECFLIDYMKQVMKGVCLYVLSVFLSYDD